MQMSMDITLYNYLRLGLFRKYYWNYIFKYSCLNACHGRGHICKCNINTGRMQTAMEENIIHILLLFGYNIMP